MLTQEQLKEALDYDPLTGLFTRKTRTSNFVKVGQIAGNKHAMGYWEIGVCGKSYLAHRLAFLYMEGKFPEKMVDHKNLNRMDNRWSNLRHATNGENMQNSSCGKRGVTGKRNVYPNGKGFMVNLQKDGKPYYIGTYPDIELAELVAEEARRKYHGEFASCSP